MSAAPDPPFIPVEQYLDSLYDPDMEYVDCILVERNLGDWLHSLIQSNVLFALRRKYPHLKVVAELRSSVTSTRFRLPDICALLAPPTTRYLADAAYLVVEVLSERDELNAATAKLKEYANKGVANIWLIDPQLQVLYSYQGTLQKIDAGGISTTDGSVEILGKKSLRSKCREYFNQTESALPVAAPLTLVL